MVDATEATGRLAGRKIAITGAASGIGEATASLFAREGASVALLDVRADHLAACADKCGGVAVEVDLTDEAAIGPSVEDAAARLGGLDGLVACAGVSVAKPLADLDAEIWHRTMAVNLTAPYLLCRAALPFLRLSNAATIVIVGSGTGLLPTGPGLVAYAASKAGAMGMAKALAAELAPTIRANAVAPGIVATPPMLDSVLKGYADSDDAPFVRQYALRRVAQPGEIAEAILFLSSEQSSYVTGTVVAVDGGRTFH